MSGHPKFAIYAGYITMLRAGEPALFARTTIFLRDIGAGVQEANPNDESTRDMHRADDARHLSILLNFCAYSAAKRGFIVFLAA
ncbi:hypothetical protein [Azospirillum himalayense]|uniref:Uncharacterized protein n=1 Tax=Azospirillum himalayense TaxID=654847 RepID=A0ABW0GEN7_9PROT